MIFGQPHKQFGVSEIVEAALRAIDHELVRVMENKQHKEYSSPFDNTGATFKCDTFEANAYSWGDDEQPFNFKWRDIEISWYKYCGRGMSANKQITPDMASDMLNDCVAALRDEQVFDLHALLEGWAMLQTELAFALHERDLLLKLLGLLLFVAYHLAHLGLRRHTLALGLEDLFLLLEVAVLDAQGAQL